MFLCLSKSHDDLLLLFLNVVPSGLSRVFEQARHKALWYCITKAGGFLLNMDVTDFSKNLEVNKEKKLTRDEKAHVLLKLRLHVVFFLSRSVVCIYCGFL